MNNKTITMEQFNQLTKTHEIIPVFDVDQDGELSATDEWCMQDDTETRYILLKHNDDLLFKEV